MANELTTLNNDIVILDQSNDLYIKNAMASMSENTRRAYSARFSAFSEFCKAAHVSALPADVLTVCHFIEYQTTAGKKYSTIAQTVAAIGKVHEVASIKDATIINPCKHARVKEALSAAARTIGTAQTPKAAATKGIVKELVSSVSGAEITQKRNAALIALGFYGAFRRSELAALKISDLERKTDSKTGLPIYVIFVARSKTDKTGKGMYKAVFSSAGVNPVKALDEWLQYYKADKDAPLFPAINHGKARDYAMRGADVANVIKATAEHAGYNSNDFSGHSLRRGFVTSAVEAGASERSIMNQTGHKSPMTVRRYIERHAVEIDNAAAVV